jgi:hypothetical protein
MRISRHRHQTILSFKYLGSLTSSPHSYHMNVAKGSQFYGLSFSKLSPDTQNHIFWGSRHCHRKLTILSQADHMNLSYCRQRLPVLSLEFLDVATRHSVSYHLSLSALSSQSHSPVIWVSQFWRQKFTVLSPEAHSPFTSSSQSSHQKLSVLSPVAHSPLIKSSQSCSQKLTVLSPLPHTRAGWVLCCSPTMSISSSSLSLCVTLPPNCEDDVGRLEKSTGPPATQIEAR